MPCYDERNTYDYGRKQATEEMQVKLDKLTRMLCTLNQQIDEGKIKRNDEMLTWWRAHKRLDERRAVSNAEARRIKHFRKP